MEQGLHFMEKLLEIRDLRIRYSCVDTPAHQAVDGIQLEIAPGEVVGLMGKSGCGKSSLALAILGLLPRETCEVRGSVLFCGRELNGMPEPALQEIRGAGISLVFQEPGISLSPVMRVGDQIAEVIHAHRRGNWKSCRDESEIMLARVDLTPTSRIFSAYPHQLSGGQRQRVVLAQALCCRPALLIADEPTASLDARSQAGFLELLRSLKEESGISILLISHTPEIQASMADRLLVMKDGRIVDQGRFDELYRRPGHEYTRWMLRRGDRPAESQTESNTEILVAEQIAR